MQIKFLEWTDTHHLWDARLAGFRGDKDARKRGQGKCWWGLLESIQYGSERKTAGEAKAGETEEAAREEASNLSLGRKLAQGLLRNVWSLIVAALTLLGGYAIFRPHVSIEPQIALNPVNPYTTQFNIKNENLIFDIYSIDAVCWPRTMQSGNNFSVVSPGPLKNVHHEIARLEPGGNSTVDCPPVIGGIGSFAGVVVDAELEIDVSYRQSWWPFSQQERYAFAAKRDVQGAVHWVHISVHEEKSFAEILGKRN